MDRRADRAIGRGGEGYRTPAWPSTGTPTGLRVLVPDAQRGSGFWFVSESRSRSDGLSGFTGHIIRGKVRGESEKGTAALLRLTKSRMEGR